MGLSLFSCSSFSWREFFGQNDSAEKRNEEMMADFEMDKELQERFAVREKKEEPKKEVKETQPQLKPAPAKQVEKKQKKRKAIRPKPPKKKIKTAEIKKKTFEYPTDYPEKLIGFDKSSKKFWEEYKPVMYPGEQMILNITYMGINTGKITIKTRDSLFLGESEVNHFHARIKTSSYYSYLYEVDDYCDSYVGKSDFLPRKFSLIQRESSQSIDDLQLFDLEKLETLALYKRETKDKKKKKKIVKPIPRYFQDPLSVVYFLRGLPLDKVASYSIPVVNQGKVELMEVKTGETETIKTEIGKQKAHVLKIQTSHQGKTIKGGDMTFWFSADERKIFLKFEAEIKIGSIRGEIESYKK